MQCHLRFVICPVFISVQSYWTITSILIILERIDSNSPVLQRFSENRYWKLYKVYKLLSLYLVTMLSCRNIWEEWRWKYREYGFFPYLTDKEVEDDINYGNNLLWIYILLLNTSNSSFIFQHHKLPKLMISLFLLRQRLWCWEAIIIESPRTCVLFSWCLNAVMIRNVFTYPVCSCGSNNLCCHLMVFEFTEDSLLTPTVSISPFNKARNSGKC